MRKIARPGLSIAAFAIAGMTALAACGGSSSSTSSNIGPAGAFGKVPPAATGTQHTGTITAAFPPGATPTWIFPVVPSANGSVYTSFEFQYQMWRPLYWLVNGVAPKEYPSMSLANDPTWSNSDKTVTVTMKSNYKWSDGQPVTSKDAEFWLDMLKAGVKESPANWGPYVPGLGMPDQITSMSTPNNTTLVINLNKSVNPTWFWENELGTVQPIPAHAWAKASASGPVLDFTNPANAKKIYDFLAAQSKSVTTYASNPLWQVVDGPYKLTSFNNTTGAFTMSPNDSYGGPHAKKISPLQGVPFTSDTAEFNAIKSGSVDTGYVPLVDLPQITKVESTYNVFGYPEFGWSYVAYNFKDTTGHFNDIIKQLYIRQAIAHLEDQQGYIKAFFHGAGGEAYGPVPSIPESPFTPANAMTNPYPFSVNSAVSLLKSHGWTVNAGRDGRVQERRHRLGPVRRRHPGRHQARVQPDLRHLAHDHRRAGHRPRLPGEEGRHRHHAGVEQLQLHDRQLQRGVVAEERQQVGHGGLRRVLATPPTRPRWACSTAPGRSTSAATPTRRRTSSSPRPPPAATRTP